jgi:hypothetical protein
MACGSQREVFQRDGAELKTDGVQALKKIIRAHKRTGAIAQVNAHKTVSLDRFIKFCK